MGAGRDPVAVPALAPVELGDQPQPCGGGGRESHGAGGDRRREFGQRAAGGMHLVGVGHGASFE
jgi:hypothetical protein